MYKKIRYYSIICDITALNKCLPLHMSFLRYHLAKYRRNLWNNHLDKAFNIDVTSSATAVKANSNCPYKITLLEII